jgi:HK97 family phage prohead protease
VKDLRRLPEPVAERLADAPAEVRRRLQAEQGGHLVECRLRPLELRTEGNTVAVHGYATVYDTAYRVGGDLGFDETIAAGAAAKSVAERDDVRFLYDHDGMPLARTKSGTMTLRSDATGLLVDATLDMASPPAAALRSAIERGDVDAMSFAFRVIRQQWNTDFTQRLISELQLFDVSAVGEPANPATVIALRGGGMDLDEAQRIAAELRSKAPAIDTSAWRPVPVPRAAPAPVSAKPEPSWQARQRAAREVQRGQR